MNSALHRTLVYQPILWLRGERATRRLTTRKLAIEQQSSNAIADIQADRLNNILAYASSAAPFYRMHWSSFTRRDLFARFGDLPFLEKRHLQDHAAELRTKTSGRVWAKSTGGSTAEPVTVWKNASGIAEERAATWAGLSWFEIGPGDPVARFWGTALTRSRRRQARLADIAMNRIRVSAFDLTDEAMKHAYERCRHFSPRWLYGYSTVMDHFAAYLERQQIDGRALGVRLAVPTSEPIPDGAAERLARVFGCAVCEEYGCGEAGAIAYSCRSGRLHICTDNVLVEVLKEDGRPAAAGEDGEIVITDLTNYAMPLIRLRMGDIATVGGVCDCGRNTPTLKRVWGRMHDTVYTPVGRRWHGEQLDYLLSTLRAAGAPIRQYQVVQVAPDLLDVRLVTTEDLTAELESRIQTFIADQLDGMRSRVKRVAAVERSPSGKLKVVRNDMRASYANTVGPDSGRVGKSGEG